MRFVLLATALRLAQAATPINDWVWGAMGASCATTCSGLGRTCDDERIWAIKGTNSGGFKAARAGAGWETAYCATEVDGFDSTGGVSYRDTNQRCYYPNTQSPISKPSGLCGFTFNGVNQQSMLCCCLVSGHDASTHCPVEGSDCDAGYEWDASSTVSAAMWRLCIPCEAGGYCLGTTATAGIRSPCPVGRFNSATGSTTAHACLPCPVGKFGLEGEKTSQALACTESCATGKFGKPNVEKPDLGGETQVETRNDESSCDECTAGTYNNENGQTACKDCSKGTYNDKEARTSITDCQNCDSGKYSDQVRASSSTDCQNCTAGSWSSTQGATNITQCIDCETGKYSTEPGRATEDSCLNCAAGKYVSASATAGASSATVCEDCVEGKWSSTPAAVSVTSCKDCVAGKFWDASSPGQISEIAGCSGICPKGTFAHSSAVGQTNETDACMACQVGLYNDFEGTDAVGENKCRKCPMGSWSNQTETREEADCKSCPKGRHGNGQTGLVQATDCTQCVPGRFSSAERLPIAPCEGACPPGKSSSSSGAVDHFTCVTCALDEFNRSKVAAQGSSECKACVGFTSPTDGHGSCAELELQKCDAGYHAVSAVSTVCEQCDPGSECELCGLGRATNISGATECNACEGDSVTGILYNATSCWKCDPGAVADALHATCSSCASGSYRVTCDSTAAPCPELTAVESAANAASTCRSCPARAATCSGGVIRLDSKFWWEGMAEGDDNNFHILDKSTQVHTCFNDECCELIEKGAAMVCNTKLGYEGPLCGACRAPEFTRSGRGCSKCWETAANVFAVIGLVLAIVTVVAYLVVQHDFAQPLGEYGGTVQKLAISHLQMLGVLGIFRARGTNVFNDVISRPAEVVGGSLTAVLPLRCALGLGYYGTFTLNMGLPWIILALAAVVLVPKTIGMRHEFERCRSAGQEAPAYKGKFGLPRCLAFFRCTRKEMEIADIEEWHKPFKPARRFAGVAVFVLFSMYPTLVASIASMFNCTEPIGKLQVKYLIADLSKTCFEGMHIFFLVLACIGVVVYAIGIPVAVALVVALKSPLTRGEEDKDNSEENDDATTPGLGGDVAVARLGGGGDATTVKEKTAPRGALKCACALRSPEKFTEMDVRTRFAFLFHGYSTDRGGAVVAWEAFVMARKLGVALAGSVIGDAYLQILCALLILSVSSLLTALVQPYETVWLTVLDTFGLFALMVTQILSIIYFYVETASYPIIERSVLEAWVTFGLFAMNAIVLVVFFVFFAAETASARQAWIEKRWTMVRIVEDPDEIEQAVARGTSAAGEFFVHPTKVAVEMPPEPILTLGVGDDDGGDAGWLWRKPFAASPHGNFPELIRVVKPDAVKAGLSVGARYRYMHPKTHKLSEPLVTLQDVGDGPCCAGKSDEEEGGGGAGMLGFVTPGAEVSLGAAVFGGSSDARTRPSRRLSNPMNRRRTGKGIELSSMADQLGAAEGGGAAAAGDEVFCDNGWDEHFDETHQHSYFVHRKSGRTSWTVKHDDDLSSVTDDDDDGSSNASESTTDDSEQDGV